MKIGIMLCSGALGIALLVGCSRASRTETRRNPTELAIPHGDQAKSSKAVPPDLAEFAKQFEQWETYRRTNKDAQVPMQFDLLKAKIVAETFAEWWENDQVPGFRKNVEGEIRVFPLWNKEARTKWLTEEMQMDIANSSNAYLINVKLTDQILHYLVSSSGTNLTLVGAYKNLDKECVRITPATNATALRPNGGSAPARR